MQMLQQKILNLGSNAMACFLTEVSYLYVQDGVNITGKKINVDATDNVHKMKFY